MYIDVSPGVSLCVAGMSLPVSLATVLVLPTPLFPLTNTLYGYSSSVYCDGGTGFSRRPKQVTFRDNDDNDNSNNFEAF